MGRTFRNDRNYFDDDYVYSNRKSNNRVKKIKTYQNSQKTDRKKYIDDTAEIDEDWDGYDERR